eukprot:m.357138 g.357138  ORF g.357138 m.357138 type:complete len:75 (-) comp19936_c1_seq2:342-566(-)
MPLTQFDPVSSPLSQLDPAGMVLRFTAGLLPNLAASAQDRVCLLVVPSRDLVCVAKKCVARFVDPDTAARVDVV